MMSTKPPPPLPSPSTPPQKSLLSRSAEGAKFLILLQVSSRLLTFGVNQLLLRYLSPSLLGISVQLELLTISILYFSRESLRNALQRQSGGSGKSVQAVINIALLTLPLGVLFSALLGSGYILRAGEAGSVRYWRESVLLYVLATLLELAAEPAFAVAQMNLWYKLRAAAESAAAAARCAVTCGVTIWGVNTGRELGALPFAMGQLAYGGVLLAVYMQRMWREGVTVGLERIDDSGKKEENDRETYHLHLFSAPISSLAGTMWLQCAIKHVLTQGDSLLITYLASLPAQGSYALASNYGSLIARMLFQPLEETSRTLFSGLLPSSPPPTPKNTTQALHVLKTISKLYLLLSLFFCALGAPFAPILLRLVAGRRWSDSAAGETLTAYCYYIPLLAINGVSEAFVQAVATPSQLHSQSLAMIGFSVCFATSGYIFVHTLALGAEGLVWANVANMLLRITWSSRFIASYFGQRGVRVAWTAVLPGAAVVATAVAVGAAVRGAVVEEFGLLRQGAWAVGAGAVLLGAVVGAERRFLTECWGTVRAGR